MADWALVVPAERYAAERLFHHEAIEFEAVEFEAVEFEAVEMTTVEMTTVEIRAVGSGAVEFGAGSGAAGPGSAGPGSAGFRQADSAPVPGDRVVLIAGGDDPVVFGLGRVCGPAPGTDPDPDDPQATDSPGTIDVEYTHRLFDAPVPAGELVDGRAAGVYALPAGAWEALAERVGAEHRVDAAKRTWLVSLDLPIEAGTPAEAVRMFWSYVRELGPRELPAFVSPSDDELAMQAFVLGAETNLDPEEAE
jgi:hypothetical protein